MDCLNYNTDPVFVTTNIPCLLLPSCDAITSKAAFNGPISLKPKYDMKLVVSPDKGLFYDLVKPYVNFIDHLRYDTHSRTVIFCLDGLTIHSEWGGREIICGKHNN